MRIARDELTNRYSTHSNNITFFCFLHFHTGEAAPKEIEHHFSVRFSGINCGNIKTHKDLLKAVKKAVNETLSTISGCHACQLTKLTVPGCELAEGKRKRRAVSHAMEVLFSLMVREALGSNSLSEDVQEKSEAVLFQMKYAVATGQFRINVNGMNTTAERSSLQHLSSSVTCSAGYVTSSNGKRCGECCICFGYVTFQINWIKKLTG